MSDESYLRGVFRAFAVYFGVGAGFGLVLVGAFAFGWIDICEVMR